LTPAHQFEASPSLTATASANSSASSGSKVLPGPERSDPNRRAALSPQSHHQRHRAGCDDWRPLSNVFPDEADDSIFGYTCVNDVTANDILNRDKTFAQRARGKGFDGYGPMPKNPPPPICPKCSTSMRFVLVKTGGRKFRCVDCDVTDLLKLPEVTKLLTGELRHPG
jgi:Fumarylacetoacetate (FAA) hydrolase family